MFTLNLYYLAIKNKFDKNYERFEIINIFLFICISNTITFNRQQLKSLDSISTRTIIQ